MATLTVTQTEDYSDGNPALDPDITGIVFNTSGPGSVTAAFGSNQFGPGLISNNLAVTGDAFTNFIRVNLSAAGAFSAAGWSFTNWSAADRVILSGSSGNDTLTGTAFNDSFQGGVGADALTGGAGDDAFIYGAGDIAFGEVIDGGTHTTADQILLVTPGIIDFSPANIIGVEQVQLLQNGLTADFDGDQLRAGAIAQVIGNTALTQAITLTSNDVDLSGVVFGGWGGLNQTITITSFNSGPPSSLIGSAQKDMISGGASAFEHIDVITGGGGADALSGVNGEDIFRYVATTDMAAGETVDGGEGSDTLDLAYTGSIDFRLGTLTSIERLKFSLGAAPTAIFGSNQFGGTGLSNALILIGDGQSLPQVKVEVRLSATGAFSAAGWSFFDFGFVDHVVLVGTAGADTITGSSRRDEITGGDGLDILTGGGEGDTFFIGAGDVVAGETIDGGTHNFLDRIELQATTDLSVATITGVESLDMNAFSATLDGSQIGASAIREVLAGSGAPVSLTVNGNQVDLSGVSFLGWDDPKTITINGNGVSPVLVGAFQERETINGAVGTPNDITGRALNDILNGGDRPDRFIFQDDFDLDDNDDEAEVINGNGNISGFDTLVLNALNSNVQNIDFGLATLNGIEAVQFLGGTWIANFNANQIGAGAILNVFGNAATLDTLVINGADIDLATTSISTWGADDVVRLNGTAGADSITGSIRNDTITGGDGADDMEGGQGDDTFRFVAGTDAPAGEIIDGGAGVDTLTFVQTGALDLRDATITSIERAVFGGSSSAHVLVRSNQFGAGFSNPITLTGGSGDNRFMVFMNAQGTFSAAGWALVDWAESDNVMLVGSLGVDTITGTSRNDILHGNNGADQLFGEAGSDTADYAGNFGAVRINLAAGTGQWNAAQGDTLSGIENVTGTSNNDVLIGDGNANALHGGLGADSLTGVGGIDTADYAGNFGAVKVNLATGTSLWNAAQGDTLSGVENINGTEFNDILTGDAAVNRLEGRGGDDLLHGAAGADTIVGGNGVDTADYAGNFGAVKVNLATGIGQFNFAHGDTLSGIENINGTEFNDILTGDAAVNRLEGRGGDDTLHGGLGADTLIGGNGADSADYAGNFGAVKIDLAAGTGRFNAAEGDTLSGIESVTGTNFNDILIGDGLANTFAGGLGNDTLTGAGGADNFLFNTTLGASNIDTITGYSVADDTIRIDDAVFTQAGALGTLAASRFHTGVAATTADHRIIYNNATGAVSYDADGSGAGAAIQFAALAAGLTMTNADFVVV